MISAGKSLATRWFVIVRRVKDRDMGFVTSDSKVIEKSLDKGYIGLEFPNQKIADEYMMKNNIQRVLPMV